MENKKTKGKLGENTDVDLRSHMNNTLRGNAGLKRGILKPRGMKYAEWPLYGIGLHIMTALVVL